MEEKEKELRTMHTYAAGWYLRIHTRRIKGPVSMNEVKWPRDAET